MTDEEFLVQLREAFSVEAAEHLQAMTAGLLDLEKASASPRRTELVETVFREAHSLKGAARAVNRTDIESVCQALESVFAQWKRKDSAATPGSFDLLNRAIDLVTRLLRMADVATGAAEQAAITRMVRDLGSPPSPAPSAPPPEAPVVAATPEPAAAAPPPPTKPRPAAPLAEDAPQIAETVRIPMAKMDALLRQAEETIAVKLIASRNAAELRGLGGVLEAWRKEWAKVREVTRTDLAAQSPAALAKLAEFLEWNQTYMRSVEKRLAALATTAAMDERGVGMLIDDLLGEAKRLVMLPFGTLFDLFPKLVRDLARTLGKEVAFSLRGHEVEIDKRILQEMKDPLIHLVRNAIDHGIESPAVRAAAHKTASSTLTLAVSQLDGNKVAIVVTDDGAGIDVERLKASAMRAGTLSEDEASALSEEAASALIFNSGISTSPIITEISGRGLGMAIVREKVDKLGGQISIETVRGAGTTFRIELPVTLATFKGILVGAGGQSFVIPTAKIERIARVRRVDIRTVENRETIALDGQTVALARLDEVLALPALAETGRFAEVVVLGSAEKRIGFVVEAVLSELEVLVKSIGKPLVRVRNVAGATILGSGIPAVILNTADLLKSAVTTAGASGSRIDRAREAAEEKRARHILVADDSVTSRMLLKNILESAGYLVVTAVDGAEALTALKSRDFDLLVSDVEMPRMDGFDLTAKVRADKKLVELPVVLVTALGSREHQERGIDVGANAYIVKGSFDQSNLLDVIRKLI
jgi:two-component system chemotaxis sensor kinase CheA